MDGIGTCSLGVGPQGDDTEPGAGRIAGGGLCAHVLVDDAAHGFAQHHHQGTCRLLGIIHPSPVCGCMCASECGMDDSVGDMRPAFRKK